MGLDLVSRDDHVNATLAQRRRVAEARERAELEREFDRKEALALQERETRERQSEAAAPGAPMYLIRAAARGDVPHRLDLVAAHRVDPVVEVDRRIAVGREELDALAEPRPARGVGDRQAPVLVAREAVLDARALHRLGRKRLVGREG